MIFSSSSDVFNGTDKLLFFRPLERFIDQWPDRSSAPAASRWLEWLDANAGKSGIRKEEIDDARVREWLVSLGKQPVEKAALLNHVRTHGLQLQEQIKYGDVESHYEAAAYAVNHGIAKRLPDDELDRLRDVRDALRARLNDPEETQFTFYSLPGGENYREVLISLPIQDTPANVASARAHLERSESNHSSPATDREALDQAAAQGWKPEDAYIDTHFHRSNILLHLRVDDRLSDDGEKTLFVQEIQSDWAQEGRKKGFKSEAPAMPAEVEMTLRSHYQQLTQNEPRFFPPQSDVIAMMQYMGAIHMKDAFRNAGLPPESAEGFHPHNYKVPDGPFVTDTKSWVGLALKRAVLMAVHEGHDRIVLISGAQAAELYDVKKTYDRVRLEIAENDQGFSLTFLDKRKEVESKYVALEAAASRYLSAEVASQLFSKLSSRRSTTLILNDGPKTVGEEGMLAFYDGIVPQVMADLVKKFGSSLEPARCGEAQVGFKVTDIMKERVNRGLPLFGMDPLAGLPLDKKAQAQKALLYLETVSKIPSPSYRTSMKIN